MTSTDGPIRWRVHLRSSPEIVYRALDSAEGRESFWAHEAPEVEDGVIEFSFLNGDTVRSRVLVRESPREWRITYFNDSVTVFELEPGTDGGTDLTVTESGVVKTSWLDNYAGWVSVLLGLKAAVDHHVDLRNGDTTRTWREGFVDV